MCMIPIVMTPKKMHKKNKNHRLDHEPFVLSPLSTIRLAMILIVKRLSYSSMDQLLISPSDDMYSSIPPKNLSVCTEVLIREVVY